MSFLAQYCYFDSYDERTISECESFTCGDKDLDDFFREDAIEYANFKMGRSYCYRLLENPRKVVCVFTLSNDSIRIYDLPHSRKDFMLRNKAQRFLEATGRYQDYQISYRGLSMEEM